MLIWSLALLASLQPLATGGLLFLAAFVYYAAASSSRASGKSSRLLLPGILIPIVYLVTCKVFPLYWESAEHLPRYISPLLVPLGISYFTFKLIHYMLESSWKAFPDHGFLDFLLYMFFLPIFPLGPIERFEHFHGKSASTFDLDLFAAGVGRLVVGFFKKVVVADILLKSCLLGLWLGVERPDDLLALESSTSTAKVWLVLVSYFLYCLTDFSSAIDIAIGFSALFGYKISENFNYPLISRNVGEFWRRWHITLGDWVRRYIYFPALGMFRSRVLALSFAMVTIGLWHGFTSTWFAWGCYHGIGLIAFVIFQDRIGRFPKVHSFFQSRKAFPLSWALTLAFVSLGYCFVGSTSMAHSIELLRGAFGLWS